MDAENQKAENAREHHKKAQLFNAAESKVNFLLVLYVFIKYKTIIIHLLFMSILIL